MGFSRDMQKQAMRDVIVYNKQGDSNPSRPIFTTVTPTPPSRPSLQSMNNNPLTCQDSVDISCDPFARFRTADGTCNNLQHNLWGSSFIPLRRFLAPQYQDGELVGVSVLVSGVAIHLLGGSVKLVRTSECPL